MRRKAIIFVLGVSCAGLLLNLLAGTARGQRCALSGDPNCVEVKTTKPRTTATKPTIKTEPKSVPKPPPRPAPKAPVVHQKTITKAIVRKPDADPPRERPRRESGAVSTPEGVAPAVSPRYNERALPKLKQCKEYNARYRYDEAIQSCTVALSIDPGNPRIFYERGYARFYRGLFDEALADLTETVKLDPALDEALYLRGTIYFQKKRFDDAISDFEGALKSGHPDPGNGKAEEANIYYKGLIAGYFAVANYDLALPIAEQYIKNAPKSFEPYRYAGICRLKLGQYDEAISRFNEAVSLGGDAEVRGWLDKAKKAKQDLLDEITAAKAAVDRDSTAATLSELARVYRKQGHLDMAIEHFSHAVLLEPRNSATYLERGQTYAQKGSFDPAVKDLDKVLELDPLNKNVYLERGRAYRGKGELDKAIDDLTQFINLKPQEPDGYIERGRAYVRKGETSKAIADFTEFIRRAPEDATGYLERASAYAAAGDRQASEKDAQRAKEKKAAELRVREF